MVLFADVSLSFVGNVAWVLLTAGHVPRPVFRNIQEKDAIKVTIDVNIVI